MSYTNSDQSQVNNINTTKDKTAILVDFQTSDTPNIEEIQTLATDLGFTIIDTLTFKANNRIFLGKGQMKMIGEKCLELNAEHVIYNGFLSGLKLKKLEYFIKVPILSRIDIIIAIFESRASTPESKLQVKLAHLLHSRAKLVRLWTHLERQQGGGRTIAGPGEKQIELDKRIINNKIEQIKKELGKTEQDRHVRSISRSSPVISLVGYTNAGKTTLFNALTKQNHTASPKPFQTLDSILRTAVFFNKQKVIISDTVGFVTHLPPFLVNAFSATLNNIKQSSVLICLHDATKLENIDQILHWLELLQVNDKPIIHVLSKIDLIDDISTLKLPVQLIDQNYITISAFDATGIQKLQERIVSLLNNHSDLEVKLNYNQTEQLNWLIKHSIKHNITYLDDSLIVNINLLTADKNRYIKLYG